MNTTSSAFKRISPPPPDQTDFEARTDQSMCGNASDVERPWYFNLTYLAVGMLFGITLVKGEVVSWYRIQEMFRLQSFHMYGVIGTAVVVGIISVALIKRFRWRTLDGEVITFPRKKFNKGQVIGGLLFGAGWALTGACPGPLFAQIGAGFFASIVTLAAAIAGTWTFGWLRARLPM